MLVSYFFKNYHAVLYLTLPYMCLRFLNKMNHSLELGFDLLIGTNIFVHVCVIYHLLKEWKMLIL